MVDRVGNCCEMMDLDRRRDRSRCVPLTSICLDVVSCRTDTGVKRCRRDGWLMFREGHSPLRAASVVSLWQLRCQGSEAGKWHSASFQK